MEVEQSLNMSLDDIINQQKKSRPVGAKSTKSPQGRQLKGKRNAPLVRPNGKQTGRGRVRPQASPQNGKKTSKQALAPKRTAMHSIGKRPHNRPVNQPRGNQSRAAGKSNQRNAPKYMPMDGNRLASQRAPPAAASNPPKLRITIDNIRAQRPVPTQPDRPGQQVVMPGRQQFVVANPVARQTSAVRVQSPQYAPAAQPIEIMETEGSYPVVASRKSYASTAARPVNAATFLRDPYRGDDFERTTSQGMRSDFGRYDGQSKQKPGGYGELMDDPDRDDRYKPRVSGAVYARSGSRSQHAY